MKYRFEISGVGIDVQLYPLTDQQLDEIRQVEERGEDVNDALSNQIMEELSLQYNYFGAVGGATVTVTDENGDEVFSELLDDIAENWDNEDAPEGWDDETGISEEEQDVIAGNVCVVRYLVEKGFYGEGEFELDEPFDPEKLFKTMKTVDEVIPYDDSYLIGLCYGDKVLPFNKDDVETTTKREEYGVAQYNGYIQATDWLVKLDSLRDEEYA